MEANKMPCLQLKIIVASHFERYVRKTFAIRIIQLCRSPSSNRDFKVRAATLLSKLISIIREQFFSSSSRSWSQGLKRNEKRFGQRANLSATPRPSPTGPRSPPDPPAHHSRCSGTRGRPASTCPAPCSPPSRVWAPLAARFLSRKAPAASQEGTSPAPASVPFQPTRCPPRLQRRFAADSAFLWHGDAARGEREAAAGTSGGSSFLAQVEAGRLAGAGPQVKPPSSAGRGPSLVISGPFSAASKQAGSSPRTALQPPQPGSRRIFPLLPP